MDKAEATTPNSYYVRKYDENGKALSSPVRVSEQEAVANFEGQGTLDASESAAAWQREQAQLNAKFGLDMAETFGEDYVNVAKRTMEQLDPEGTKARKDLGALVGEDFLDARGLARDSLTTGQPNQCKDFRKMTAPHFSTQSRRGEWSVSGTPSEWSVFPTPRTWSVFPTRKARSLSPEADQA